MKSHGPVLAGCLAVLFCLYLSASPAAVAPEPQAAERINESIGITSEPALPEDAGTWYTTVFVHDDWQSRKLDREAIAAFDTVPALASLKSQTRWTIYNESNPHYRQRLAKHFPTLPAVVVQRASGEVVFKASGPRVSPNVLSVAIAEEINQGQWRCYGGRCYRVDQPQPQKQSEPAKKERPEDADRERKAGGLVPDVMPSRFLRLAGSDGVKNLIVMASIALAGYAFWRRKS